MDPATRWTIRCVCPFTSRPAPCYMPGTVSAGSYLSGSSLSEYNNKSTLSGFNAKCVKQERTVLCSSYEQCVLLGSAMTSSAAMIFLLKRKCAELLLRLISWPWPEGSQQVFPRNGWLSQLTAVSFQEMMPSIIWLKIKKTNRFSGIFSKFHI